jgi:hypothetical protein
MLLSQLFLSSRMEAEYEAKEILIDTLSDVYGARHQLRSIPVIYHSITHYNQELRVINKVLHENRELENKYKGVTKTVVPLYLFYTNNLGLMIDAISETEEFIDNVNSIWSYIEENRKNVNQFPASYNIRILRYVDSNLEEIIQQLSIYSEAVQDGYRRQKRYSTAFKQWWR